MSKGLELIPVSRQSDRRWRTRSHKPGASLLLLSASTAIAFSAREHHRQWKVRNYTA